VTTPTVHATSPGQPLAGKRIALTRPRAQAGDFEARIRALGGEPLLAPAIAIVTPEAWTIADAALRRVETYDWIVFTSANAVHAVVERADAIGISRGAVRGRRLATVGPATATAVRAALREPDFMPATTTAEALAHELRDVERTRILFPRGDLAGDTLPAELRQRGAFVDAVVVYRTIPGDGVAAIVAGIRAGTVDALLFTSASAVRFVAEALADELRDGAAADLPRHPAVMCIGPTTADAARAAGLDPVSVAESAAQSELIDQVARWFGARQHVEPRE
jgi:uroporphyrinogen-III synthase